MKIHAEFCVDADYRQSWVKFTSRSTLHGTDELISMNQKMTAMTTKASIIQSISFRSSESSLFFDLELPFISNGMYMEILSAGETQISL
jgi:hypothetical protein